jgi:tetratricopeptide (TPR) repeat protein
MTRLIIPAAFLAAVLFSSGDDVSVPATSGAAIERFWDVYHGNDYGDIARVQAQLQQALQSDPNNATLYALLGATHFWHVGEYTRDPKPDPNALRQDMPTAVNLFQKALDLDYCGKHLIGYINDDHLPGYLGITTVHAGQQSNDPNVIAKGGQILDFAAYQFPEFNNFNRWAAHNTDPKDSDTYKKALDSLWQAIDVCAGATVDRANPDLGPYLHLQTPVGRKKACWSQGDLAPHSFEGFMLNLGNGLVKAGQVEAAKVVYANAKYADHYADWPYRSVLEAIAGSDLYARAALYADSDPSNDPPLGVPNRGCVYCHATVSESAAHQLSATH